MANPFGEETDRVQMNPPSGSPNGNLPTPRDHSLGGYETWPARSSYLEVQASEKIRDELLRLLKNVRSWN